MSRLCTSNEVCKTNVSSVQPLNRDGPPAKVVGGEFKTCADAMCPPFPQLFDRVTVRQMSNLKASEEGFPRWDIGKDKSMHVQCRGWGKRMTPWEHVGSGGEINETLCSRDHFCSLAQLAELRQMPLIPPNMATGISTTPHKGTRLRDRYRSLMASAPL